MSQFTVQVNGPAYGSSASFRALKFCQAAIASGHQIITVFFYQAGVSNSSALLSPASDEINLNALWAEFGNTYQVPLVNCVSAALRRGLLSEQDAQENAKQQWNVAAPFIMGGLGELAIGIEKADRLISF